MSDNRPQVFIGSSSEGKAVADYLQLTLEDYGDAVVWDQGVFGLSTTSVDSLKSATEEYDFAVLVVTPDDLLQKRSETARAPRDNVLFELGLFMGALGFRRTFIVHSQEDEIEFPGDLAGFTRATYRPRKDGNLRAALRPLSLKLRIAMEEVGPRARNTRTSEIPVSTVSYDLLGKYVSDLTEALPGGRMGVAAELQDPDDYYIWTHNLLGMLADLYQVRQADTYAAWLRPLEHSPNRLAVFQSRNMPTEYIPYEFYMDEGLAGKVWSTGEPAATSKLRQHPWWVYRDGCLTESYICVPVGPPKGPGGVLATGSFTGFEVTEEDYVVVRIFAALLSLIRTPPPAKRLRDQQAYEAL